MLRSLLWLAVCAAAGSAGAGPAAADPPSSSPPGSLGFRGAYLGMSLEDWRRAPFPGAPDPRVAPSCTAGDGQGGLVRAGGDVGRAETCAYVARYGPVVLTEDVPWTSGLLAKSPRYVFTDGRLSRIDIRVGIDAFDAVMARMKQRYGAPSRMVRDTLKTRVGGLPRVSVRWDLKTGAIELVDPAADLANMTISFVATPAGQTFASAR